MTIFQWSQAATSNVVKSVNFNSQYKPWYHVYPSSDHHSSQTRPRPRTYVYYSHAFCISQHVHHSKSHGIVHFMDSRVNSLDYRSTHTLPCTLSISSPLYISGYLHLFTSSTQPLCTVSPRTLRMVTLDQSQAMFNQSGLTMGASSPPGPMDTSGYLPPFLLGTPATKSVCLYIWHTLVGGP